MRKINFTARRTRRVTLILVLFVIFLLLAAGTINLVLSMTQGLSSGADKVQKQQAYDEADWGTVPGS